MKSFDPSDYASREEFLAALKAESDRNNWIVKKKPLPAGLEKVRPSDERGGRQVGLRLPETDYRRLVKLANEFAVTPATLARMLVVRAVRRHAD